MSHFAKIENGIVTNVIIAEQDIINTGLFGDPATWVQTSYNTRGGVHYGMDGKPDGGIALRANYAVIGHIYDKENDVFHMNKPIDVNGLPCDSWTLSAPTWLWEPPKPMPMDNNLYGWNEAAKEWDMILNVNTMGTTTL
jgi:hypothetical protein